MKLGFPWSVKDIRPEARDIAREAARRAGLPLNEWLNAVIVQQAQQANVQSVHSPAPVRADDAARADYSEVQLRLDNLARRMDQVTHGGPAAYAPKRTRDDADQVAELIGRIEQRFDQFAGSRPPAMPNTPMPPAFDRAVAEINARRRTLNGETMPAPAPVAMPMQDLSGLEGELRRVTSQIETLRRPDVEEAINALRAELGEIGRTLNEAMPRRAIETIEKQVQDLTQRIADGRQAGVNAGALAGIEHGLAEVRNALRDLTPAENLVGYTDAINALAHKIDLIVAQQDPATMMQLENSISTLREMATHVASNETVNNLATQVQSLSAKVDQLAMSGTNAALGKLEQRIDEVSRVLAERAQAGDGLPPRLEALLQSMSDKIEQMQQSRSDAAAFGHLEDRPPRLEALLQSMSDKIEQLQQSRSDPAAFGHLEDRPPRLEALLQSMSDKIEQLQQSRSDAAAFGHLEDRIVKLVERLDASDSRLGHLESIERGLTDLLVHIEDLRANKQSSALRAEDTSGIDTLKQGVARTQSTVDSMHGTLGQVVERLTVIEKDIRREKQAPAAPVNDVLELTQPVGNAAAPAVTDASEAALQPAVTSRADMLSSISAALLPAASEPPPPVLPTKPVPPASLAPIESSLQPDQPLEPGSGPPRANMNPGARIAASEAALGGVRPTMATPGSKSDFIAAARRAAQAAGQDPKTRSSRPDASKGGESNSLRSKVMTRVKSLFLAASIVAIVVGSIQFAGNIFNFGIFDTIGVKLTQDLQTDTPTGDEPDATAEADTGTPAGDLLASPNAPAAPRAQSDAEITASLLAPPTMPVVTPAKPSAATGMPAVQPPMGVPPAAQAPSPVTNPLALNLPLPVAPLESKPDVTGSVSRAPADTRNNRQQQAPATPPAPDRLPAAIGGPRLRNAAQGGDAGAAYEIATRFAEGRGVPANLDEAARWYELAASKGLTPAQFRYASMLEKGQGVKKDLESARKLYGAAAGKGHAKAMHNLAVLYAEGVDGKPDYASAAQWFRKAAEHGVPDSQYNLGVLAARGIGMDRNVVESYKWFALAAAQGDKDAGRKRDEIATQLDAQTLAGAQQTIKSYAAQAQPAEAITIPEPPGGWDRTTPASPEKPRAGAPLQIGAFNSGKL
jgi:localization factor PodJL